MGVKMRESRLKKIFIVSIILTFLLSIFTLSFIWLTEKEYVKDDKTAKKISILGEYYVEGQDEKNVLPIDENINLSGHNKIIIIGHFSEEIEKNKQLIMRIDNMIVNIFLNEKKIYSFGEKGTFPHYSNSPGNVWKSFVSPGISKNDEIKIELSNIYTNHIYETYFSFLNNLYSGYESEIILNSLRESTFNYLVPALAICVGIICIIISFKLAHIKDLVSTVFSFACMSITSGIWFFIDFQRQSYIINYPIFNNSLDILIMLLALISLLIYVSVFLSNKCKKYLIIVAYSILVVIVISTVLQLLGIKDYYDFVPIIYVLCSASAISILGTVFYEWYKFKDKKLKILVISITILCFGIIGDVIFMYFQIHSFIFWIKISYILFLIIQILNIVNAIKVIMSENIKINLLKEIAYKDMLTGINNRTAYVDKVNAIKKSLNSKYLFGIIVFDVNNLKVINDTLGHDEGDRIIKYTAKIISSIFSKDNVYRIGGDEFVVILEDSEYYKHIELMNNIKCKLSKLDDISIACGLAIYDSNIDKSYEDVFNRADNNMYVNKKNIKNKKHMNVNTHR